MDSAAVMGRAAGENFPVASRVLPRRVRSHLLALYGFARLLDEVGDGPTLPAQYRAAVGADAEGDRAGTPLASGSAGASESLTGSGPPSAAQRLAVLDELEADLDRSYRGEARHPLLVALQPTLRECGLAREPFVRLIEANRMDQRVERYETWEQLRGYCELSANPVGELVLGVFGADTPERVRLSDAVCTALQLVEHCQDVAEDRERGRVYLPREDLAGCGASEADLDAQHAGEPLRATIALEIARARGLLSEGAPLIGELHGVRERLAVAAFVAGGRAACDAIERAGWDVLAGAPRAGAWLRARALTATLREARGRRSREASPRLRREACDPSTGPRRSVGDSQGKSPVALERAYSHCESITRREAANFYHGIRLLTPARRRAMCAVYAFARRIDDIGDGGLPPARKLSLLDEQDRALTGLAEEAPEDDVLMALSDAYVRFDIPPDALRALIAGVRMDVEDVRYETFDELVVYCRRVAGAIGRACLAIFALRDPGGMDRAAADRLADDLGVALQLTNILRDIREDAHRGRVYLPAEDLRRYGVTAIRGGNGPEGASGGNGPGEISRGNGSDWRELDRIDGPELEQVQALIRFQASRAREWFDRGLALAPLLDRRSRACLLAMARIYNRLLDRIAAHPERVLHERVSLPVHEKAWVAARSMLGGGP